MKVKIGKYLKWWGPYQIAELLCFWEHFLPKGEFNKRFDKHSRKLGEWLSDTWVNMLCEWIHEKRDRTIKVKIDYWDSWSADETLAHIIYPLLLNLKKDKHGSGMVDNEDVPDSIRSTNDLEWNALPDQDKGWKTDKFIHDRWDYVLDEMIWTFKELSCNGNGENQFYSGNPSFSSEHPDTFRIDSEGLKVYNERIENGLHLFGKYYRSLWT